MTEHRRPYRPTLRPPTHNYRVDEAMAAISETLQNSRPDGANVPTNQMFTVDSLASLPPRDNPIQNYTRDAANAYLKQSLIAALKPLYDMIAMLALAGYCRTNLTHSPWADFCHVMLRQINPALEMALTAERVVWMQFRPGPVVANPTNAAIDRAVSQGMWFIELRAHNALLERRTFSTLSAALRWLIVTSQEQHSGRYDLPHGVYSELSDMPPRPLESFSPDGEDTPESADRPVTTQSVRQIVID